jgi:hypothetical protein
VRGGGFEVREQLRHRRRWARVDEQYRNKRFRSEGLAW